MWSDELLPNFVSCSDPARHITLNKTRIFKDVVIFLFSISGHLWFISRVVVRTNVYHNTEYYIIDWMFGYNNSS